MNFHKPIISHQHRSCFRLGSIDSVQMQSSSFQRWSKQQRFNKGACFLWSYFEREVKEVIKIWLFCLLVHVCQLEACVQKSLMCTFNIYSISLMKKNKLFLHYTFLYNQILSWFISLPLICKSCSWLWRTTRIPEMFFFIIIFYKI